MVDYFALLIFSLVEMLHEFNEPSPHINLNGERRHKFAFETNILADFFIRCLRIIEMFETGVVGWPKCLILQKNQLKRLTMKDQNFLRPYPFIDIWMVLMHCKYIQWNYSGNGTHVKSVRFTSICHIQSNVEVAVKKL